MTDDELIAGFREWMRVREYSWNTIRRRDVSLRRLRRQLAPGGLLDATGDDCEEYLAGITNPGTRHHYRSDLMAFYTWAVRRKLTEVNPAAATEHIRVPKHAPKPAPLAAIEAGLLVADADVQLAILLGALAGLRIGEIAALDMANVHLDADPPVLHVVEGKGRKDRIVPLHPLLVERLRGRSGRLFTPAYGGARSLRAEQLGKRVAAALSIDGTHVTAHQLRHFFGTEAARQSNGNLLLVGRLMGHANPQTTAGYVAWAPSEGAEVVARIAVEDELTRRRRARAG